METMQYGCGCEHSQYGGCGCATMIVPAEKNPYGGRPGSRRKSRSPSAFTRTFIGGRRAASREAKAAMQNWMAPPPSRAAKKKSGTRSRTKSSLETTSLRELAVSRRRRRRGDDSGSGESKKPRAVARTRYSKTKTAAIREKNKRYFLRPETMTSDEKKYCRCLADVAAKQGSRCLRERTTGKGCYSPWAICGRLKPKSMGNRGCAMLYDYDTMPYAQAKATADLHNKTIKELIEAAKDEAKRMKWS